MVQNYSERQDVDIYIVCMSFVGMLDSFTRTFSGF